MKSNFEKIYNESIKSPENFWKEIADDIFSIDRSMRWGFGWDMGPFEVWDTIGLELSVKKMLEDMMSVPKWVLDMITSGHTSFYKYIENIIHYYDVDTKSYKPLPASDNSITFMSLKKQNNTIKKGWSASVIDMGDEIVGVELHSVLKEDLNPIDGSIMETLKFAVVEKTD